MLSDDPALREVEAAIADADIPPVPGVLTGYLLLTEWVAADGETYLVESAPNAQAYWKTLGFVEATRASLQQRVQSLYEDSEDGE